MNKNTKRVHELEVGDIVNAPYDKSVLTIKSVRRLAENAYQIGYRGLNNLWSYGGSEEFTYLGNNKEERIMEAKVDESALNPYFDLLVSDEVRLKGSTNIPVYVKQQLKNIHELFEDVLGLTLEEVKTLYFERKMSKQEATKTKKVYELLSGDVVIEPNCSNWKIVSKIKIANKDSGVYRVFYETDSPPNLGNYKHTDTFTYLHNVSNLENKKVDSEFITKKAKELCIGDKVVFSLRYDGYEGEEIVTKLREFSPTRIEIVTEQGTEAIFKKDKIVSIID